MDTHDKAMLTCPYRVGVGACVSGCWEEPICQTDEPEHGWAWRNKDGQYAPAPTRAQLEQVAADRKARHVAAVERLQQSDVF